MDKETAMKVALLRAGLLPAHRPMEGPRFGERSAVVFCDPRTLRDDELRHEFNLVQAEAADIQRQLDDDLDEEVRRGGTWRGNAKRARRSKLLRVDQLKQEAGTRGVTIDFIEAAKAQAATAAKTANREESLRIENALAEAKATAKATAKKEVQERHMAAVEAAANAKTARIAQKNTQQKHLDRLFVEAARATLSAADFMQLWQTARIMFPDHEEWADMT